MVEKAVHSYLVYFSGLVTLMLSAYIILHT